MIIFKCISSNLKRNTRYAVRNTIPSKGITLVEMVVVIVVLGMAIPVLLSAWANVAWRSSRSEAIADATFYGEELMEWVKSKRFDEKTAPPWTNSASFGVDAGENSANMDTFDDVDDFVNASDTRVTQSPGGYRRSVAVEYVYLDTAPNPDAWASCGAVSCGAITDCAACAQCCFKRVSVTIRHNANLISDVTLTTIVR